MGLGPARLAEAGIGSIPGVSIDTIEVVERPFELGTTAKVLRSISEKVQLAAQDNRFPMLLAGGCISTVGALAGLNSAASAAVIWFDAHADFNTPETTLSGFIDGMALAAASGRCWRNLTASIPGFHPVPERNLVLVGARHFDPDERKALDCSEITYLDTLSLRGGWEEAMAAAVRKLPEHVYLHVDLDVLDRSEAVVNEYSSPGGLTLAALSQIIRFIGHERAIVGAAITAYDPAVDHDGKAASAGVAVAKELLAAACIDVN